MSVDISNKSKNTHLYESSQILCKNNCGYYGNSIQWNGYCSICYRQLIAKKQDEAAAAAAVASGKNLKIDTLTAINKHIWNEATNFTKFSSKKKQSIDKTANRFNNLFRRSSSQALLNSEAHTTNTEQHSQSHNNLQQHQQKQQQIDKTLLKQLDIDLIKQTFPQLYVQLHKKMNSFLDQFHDLLRNKTSNERQYEIVQEFYKQILYYIQNHSSIKTYHGSVQTNQSSDTISLHSTGGLNTSFNSDDDIEKFQDSLMIYVETYITNALYDYIFPLIMAEFEDNDIKLQKHIRNLYWVTNDMIGTYLDENSILYRDFYEESLSYIIQMDSKRTPHDKMLCITECSKNIYKALNVSINNKQQMNVTPSADDYLPAVIYLVLKANPTLLYSNMNYIARFAFEKRVLQGEHAYYFCSLNAVITHIENLNAQHLNLTQEQFDKYCLGLVNSNNLSIKLIQTNLKLLNELKEKQELLKVEAKKLDTDMNEFYKFMKLKVKNSIINNKFNKKYLDNNVKLVNSVADEVKEGILINLADDKTTTTPVSSSVEDIKQESPILSTTTDTDLVNTDENSNNISTINSESGKTDVSQDQITDNSNKLIDECLIKDINSEINQQLDECIPESNVQV